MKLKQYPLDQRAFVYCEPEIGPVSTGNRIGYRVTYEEIICLGTDAPDYQMCLVQYDEDIFSTRCWCSPLEVYAGIAHAQHKLDKSWKLKAKVFVGRYLWPRDSGGPLSLFATMLLSIIVGVVASIFVAGVVGVIILLLGG